ncbi:MAG: hypothetical protein E4H36_12945 [Spirochaetales bacterium]|nr:MAG: hypothetical protein E4H36_12945 [Spirochaetales bacterium]
MAGKMPHEHHENHLCYLVEQGLLKNKPEEYTALVKSGGYMCKGCGRIAKSADSLCAPQKL